VLPNTTIAPYLNDNFTVGTTVTYVPEEDMVRGAACWIPFLPPPPPLRQAWVGM
jgi:hypothetical protein